MKSLWILFVVVSSSVFFCIAAPASNFEEDRREFLDLAQEFNAVVARIAKDLEEEQGMQEKDKGPVLQKAEEPEPVLQEDDSQVLETRGGRGQYKWKGPTIDDGPETVIASERNYKHKGPVLTDDTDSDVTIKELLDILVKLKSEAKTSSSS